MNQTGIVIKFRTWDCEIEVAEYLNGRTCIEFIDLDTCEPVLTATVNVPEAHLDENEVVIKNYSENEGVLNCMVKNSLIKPTGRFHDNNPFPYLFPN